MNDNIVTAIVASLSAIAGGAMTTIIGPFIKHRLEQASSATNRRREQIEKWRQMLLEVDRAADGDINPGPILQVHPAFMSLEPHLTAETKLAVYGENRTHVVGSSLALPLQKVKTDISRIEKEWGLQ